MVAMPSSFVVPLSWNDDVALLTTIFAFCTGRCCGSCTMAFTVPNTEALAPRGARQQASRIAIPLNALRIFNAIDTLGSFKPAHSFQQYANYPKIIRGRLHRLLPAPFFFRAQRRKPKTLRELKQAFRAENFQG